MHCFPCATFLACVSRHLLSLQFFKSLTLVPPRALVPGYSKMGDNQAKIPSTVQKVSLKGRSQPSKPLQCCPSNIRCSWTNPIMSTFAGKELQDNRSGC